ncbi:superoxide dismutase [Pacificimonas sp. ICDLI1SI03]|jgi:Fe-Mn family superoxide dismutase|tara:strand:+ start:93857 stop:94471 length:615 start_codon:yes stop_codon:yes gene_type:complete
MAVTFPDLPYAQDALAPAISAETLSYHHGKHHKAYVTKTNDAIKGTDLENKSLVEIVRAAKAKGDQGLFNNSAQSWNHTFLWNSYSPNGGGEPTGKLKELVDSAFGSLDDFKSKFKEKATGNFASGWTWLCLSGNSVEILNTDDADTPLVHDGKKALLTLDVWEHAYYLDKQNDRGAYVDDFLNKLINWDFAAQNLDKDEENLV